MLSGRRLLTLIATLGTGLALVTSPGAVPASHVAIRLEPGTWPTYVASGFGSIWVASHRPSAHGPLLYRIDPRTNRIVARLRLPDNACWHPAVGAGYVWVSACGGEVANPVVFKVKVGRRGMKVVGRVRGENPVFGDGSLWVQNPRADRVLRVDPRSGLVLARIDPRFTLRNLRLGDERHAGTAPLARGRWPRSPAVGPRQVTLIPRSTN